MEEEIRKLTCSIFEEHLWLIEKIAAQVPVENVLFFEMMEGMADGISMYSGFFVTPAKEVYSFSGKSEFDMDADEWKESFELEKIEKPGAPEKLAGEYPLMEIALQMQDK